MKKKTKKKRIRFKGLIAIILLVYLLGTFLYYIWKMPIKNIYINGNNYLKDNYLISYLDIDNESIIKISKNSIKDKLLKLDLISDVKIKKSIFGTINIEVEEDKVLFYNRNNKKYILASGKEVDDNYIFLGIPTLINYTKDSVYQEVIEKLKKVDNDILVMISEIEYKPSEINGKIVDDKRFLLRMNDGNIVYINTTNIEKINNYLEIYEGIVNKNGNIRGCLYLDSNSENKHFNKCDEAYKWEDINEN